MSVGSRRLLLLGLEETRVRPAFLRVVGAAPTEWEDKSVNPLEDGEQTQLSSIHAFSIEWAKREVTRCATARAFKDFVVPATAITTVRKYHAMPEGGSDREEYQSEVLSFQSGGQIRFFRPFDRLDPYETTEARKTMAASRLSQLMLNELIVRAEVAVLNGRVGVLIEHCRGEPGREVALIGSEPARDLSEIGAARFLAMGFFVGNHDLHHANYAVDAEGNAQILDSGHAFYPGVPPLRFQIAGDILPDKYSKAFMASLEKFDPPFIRRHFADILCAGEQDGTFLRRQIILDDAANRNAVPLP